MTLQQVKQHLVISEDFTKDDGMLNVYIEAGKEAIANYLHEPFNKDSVTQKQALLLLVGSWYASRESIVLGTIVSKLPYGIEFLLDTQKRMLI